MRLEQYEDTLNNLVTVPNTLDAEGQFYDGFLLGYMLDLETRDSLFNQEWFKNPFDMKLRITRNNEMKEEKVDLVETFNYLIGLYVDQIAYPKTGICTVTGRTRQGKKALVIWRDCNEVSNKDLNDFFHRLAYSVRDNEFDVIYVNGDNNLDNLRAENDAWKVVLIEQEFNRQMFNC
jgi:adenine-specific DNA-methyltransferase